MTGRQIPGGRGGLNCFLWKAVRQAAWAQKNLGLLALVFLPFIIYTDNMKKLLLILFTCVLAGGAAFAAPIFADDYTFQKQIIVSNADDTVTCQAFRIHQNWFATAAHCVKMCVASAKGCRTKIYLARGEVNAFVTVDPRRIFIPKQYRKLDAKGQMLADKKWDVALIHYEPDEYLYEFAQGGMATESEFAAALQEDPNLKTQWRGAKNPKIPALYIYGGDELKTLKSNIIVPRWENGRMSVFENPKSVLYFGNNQAVWGSEGFGVDHGNSGGAVVLEDGGVMGIATAKLDQKLPPDVQSAFPNFGQTDESFVFNGFAPHTTFSFIKKTMARFGDRPVTQKFRRFAPVEEPVL